ncbi:MAG TPA: hypothetical protein VJ762_10030 [Sphingobium sp.]|nr:hypothetical protein [Sphingobium sp.]
MFLNNDAAPSGRLTATAAVLAAALLATACTTTGTGIGSSQAPGAAATFNWSSEGPRTGSMTAMLADGRQYTGGFFQITSETRVEDLTPLWVGWGPIYGRRFHRGGWDYWGPSDQFVTHYSGKVLANLAGPGGQMRCRFTLIHPASGMSGGGEGTCQLPGGTHIQASFAPH